MGYVTHTSESWHTYEWVTAHTLSHTYEWDWVMAHISMSQEHIRMSHHIQSSWTCQSVASLWADRCVYTCVMTHSCVCVYTHVYGVIKATSINDSWHLNETHVRMSHCTHMNETWNIYERAPCSNEFDTGSLWADRCVYMCVMTNSYVYIHTLMIESCHEVVPRCGWCDTGWRRGIGCPKTKVSFRKRAMNYRALLREETYIDKACYGSCRWRCDTG